MMGMTITVSTDGSALGNPNGPMGWAWADHDNATAHHAGHEHDGDCDAGGATNGTNQIGELCAVLEALRSHPGEEDLLIETDSQYAINCSTKWVHGWKKNGWKNAQKKPVKNAPLIKAIDAEISRRPGPVRFKWVKGHAGNPGNEKVDDLAHTYSGDARSGVKDGYLPLEGWQSLLASPYAKGVDIPSDAQLLIDGAITAEQYHLGRGVSSPSIPVMSHKPSSTSQPMSQQTAGAVSEDESGTAHDESATVASAVDTQAASGTEPVDATQSAASPSAATTVEPTKTASAGLQPTASRSPVRAAAGRSAQGLTVSGTLRFSPPPSSSSSYDGRPRLVRGFIAVEGYVEGNGDIHIDRAPFTVQG